VLTLPELRARDPSPPQDLPVVHVEDESVVGLRLDGRRIEEGLAHLESTEGADSEPDGSGETWDASSAADPSVPDLPVLEAADTSSEEAFNSEVFGSGVHVEDEAPSPRSVAEPGPALQRDAEPAPSLPPAEQPAPSAAPESSAPPAQPSASTLRVEWPPEEDRRIIALRLVSVSPERFSGRAIRTALVAEGFVHGKFSIFHKPDAQHRAVLSAASLSKPGMFDLETIDSQRFAGLNLFAVLSRSQSTREPFEMLLACARNLNERLQGGLQDERGGPLTPSRVAALRESLGAAPAPLS